VNSFLAYGQSVDPAAAVRAADDAAGLAGGLGLDHLADDLAPPEGSPLISIADRLDDDHARRHAVLLRRHGDLVDGGRLDAAEVCGVG